MPVPAPEGGGRVREHPLHLRKAKKGREMDVQLTDDQVDELWSALQERENELMEATVADGNNRGSSRSSVRLIRGRLAIEAHLKVFWKDGRTRLYLIEAWYDGKGVLQTRVEDFWSDNDEFWAKRLDSLGKRNLIVNSKFYSLGDEERDADGNLRRGGGFGGRMVRFQRVTWVGGDPGDPGAYRVIGEVEETRNLWFGGVIPPAWRDSLVDNAVFLGDFDGPVNIP